MSERIYFVYVNESKQSGQRRATELVISALAHSPEVVVERVPLPSLDRQKGRLLAAIGLLFHTLSVWVGFVCKFIRLPGRVHINLSQSYAGFLREGVVLLLAWALRSPDLVVSLHGSWFLRWSPGSLKATIFRFLLNRARVVTVLGPDQKDYVRDILGVCVEVTVVDNTCDTPALDEAAITRKHQVSGIPTILFLSHLIDTKGFPEYLEALVIYSKKREAVPIRAVLCGSIVIPAFRTRFSSVAEASCFIEDRINIINNSGVVSIVWLRGAEGKEKEILLRDSQIFVFPSRIEAQPLVILEAMASGCAILATSVGQIPRMIGDRGGLLIRASTPDCIAAHLFDLVMNEELRISLAVNASRRFSELFSRERHDDNWLCLFRGKTLLAPARETQRQRLWFIVAAAKGFSGQAMATKIVMGGVNKSRWQVDLIDSPALDRTKDTFGDYWIAVFDTIEYLFNSVLAAISSDPVVHLNLGQSKIGLLRDGASLLLIMGVRKQKKAVISLHGNNFLRWTPNSFERRIFSLLCAHAKIVTVLSERQKETIESWQSTPARVQTVENCCEVDWMSEDSITSKHQTASTINVLFLSSLIESKGYCEFLLATLELASRSRMKFEVVMCGLVTKSDWSDRFSNQADAEAWINEKMIAINHSKNVSVTWIRGASGSEKWKLYNNAHIFILPTYYPTEAQPLVLIEAMAFGCAIITTRQGEIPAMFADKSVSLHDTADYKKIAADVERLAGNLELRRSLALRASQAGRSRFSYLHHLRAWENIFEEISQ